MLLQCRSEKNNNLTNEVSAWKMLIQTSTRCICRAGFNWWEAWGEINIEGFGGRPPFGGRPNAK